MTNVGDWVAYVAIGAATAALTSLLLTAWLALRLRRVRSAQRTVLGDRNAVDLVEHVANITGRADDLHDYVADMAAKLDTRTARVEQTLDHALIHRAVIRYDAFNEMSGQQSCSIALLDTNHSGIVLTHLMRRNQARLYVRHIVAGQGAGGHPLAPEETAVIEQAIQAHGDGDSQEQTP